MDATFPRLVSLACHDLRTPLATVQGFAKTLLRGDVDPQTARWLGLIDEAADEVVELLELLSLSARVESGRYDPVARDVDSLELAQQAVPGASGQGAPVSVDVDAVERALAGLVRAAERHGGVEARVAVEGRRIAIEPVTAEAAPIVLGEDLKELAAAVGVRVLAAIGAEVSLEGERLTVTLPQPGA
ncbi:MAG TPA: histidine kinase dimerization/phospho-acceptor domain-containing protein [Gaiellaceae bacterium]|nr:histidine kinase dimerization/phospho-acceptor domain-containing protein [Gaiellaceae bacterium]